MSAKTVELNISKYISDSWKLFQKEWKFLLQAGLIVMLVQLIPNISQVIMGEDNSLLPLISLISMVLGMVIGIGWIKILINLTRGKKVVLSDLWGSIDRIIPYFIATLGVGLIVLVGFIFFIIPGFYLAFKYMFVPYLIIDRKVSVSEAFRMSGKMTEGIKWQLLAMWFAVFVLNILGLLAFIVGVVITSVLTSLAYAKLYNDVYKKRIE